MKAIVIYSSKTGNTKRVAEAILSALPKGTPLITTRDVQRVADYDLVFMGYWVDKGTADTAAQEAMAKITGKMVAIFSTCGVYPDSQHAKDSLVKGASCFGDHCSVLGTFICQGAIDPKLMEQFKQLPPNHVHAATPERIQRWKDAATHPDDTDLDNAVAFAGDILVKAEKMIAMKNGDSLS